MSQMIFFSMFIHLFLIGVISVLPFFKPKETTYTPVYTVNLVSLPKIKKPSIKKRRPKPKPNPKPVKLLSKQKKSAALAKLKMLEKEVNVKKKKELLDEENIPEMLAALDDIGKKESGLLEKEKNPKENLLEDLNKLEEDLLQNKNGDYDDENKSKSLEQIEKLEKKWKEERAKFQDYPELDVSEIDEALIKLIGSAALNSNQNIDPTPSYLSIYTTIIRNRVFANWENPAGKEILSEKETNKRTIVSFNVIRSGHIEDIKIEKSSGNKTLDNTAIGAVKNSNPLPPLSAKFHEPILRVKVDFNYSLK